LPQRLAGPSEQPALQRTRPYRYTAAAAAAAAGTAVTAAAAAVPTFVTVLLLLLQHSFKHVVAMCWLLAMLQLRYRRTASTAR
jgi:hypothetical protein